MDLDGTGRKINPEISLINHIIKSKDMISPLNADCEKSFILFKDEWDFIREYYTKHREVPPGDVFYSKFDDFEYYNTDGVMEHYIEELHKWKARHVLQEVITEAAGNLRDDGPFMTINKMQRELAKLGRDTKLVRDLDLVNNTNERIENLRERIALRASGKNIIGVPSGIKTLDEAFGGFQKGDFVVVAGWTGSLKCAAKGTRVIRDDGSFACIEDIEPGDSVLSFNMNAAMPQKVMSFMEQGEQECFEVTLDSGKKIELTANHPLHTPNGWMKLEDISVGDFVSAPAYLPEPMMPEQHGAAFMRLLGMLCGDGNMTKKTEVSFCNMDEEVWWLFERCANALGHQLGKVQKKKGGKAHTRTILDPHGSLRKRLGSLMGKKCTERQMPKQAFTASNDELAQFIAGLWDTDGSVGSSISITLSNETFIRDLQILLMRFGINSKLSSVPQVGSWSLSIRDVDSVLNFIANIDLVHKSKRQKLLDIGERYVNRGDSRRFPVTDFLRDLIKASSFPKNSNVSHIVKPSRLGESITFSQAEEIMHATSSQELMAMLQTHLVWDRVESITSVGTKETFDLEMDGEPNFVANGINIHNSWLALLWARNAWLQGYRVLYFSLEMSGLQIGYRFDTLLSGLQGQGITNSGLTHATNITFDKYKNWLGEITKDKHPFVVVTNEDLDDVTQNTVLAKIEQWKPDLVVLDYHGLFDDASGAIGEVEKTKNLSKAFKRIAIKTGVPIIDITGVTMPQGSHGERPPELSELAWSKQLAYDSDLTIAVCKRGDKLEAVSRKCRRGKEFKFYLDWNVDEGIVKEIEVGSFFDEDD